MKIKLGSLSYQTAVENQAANALVAQVPKLTWVKYQLTFGKKVCLVNFASCFYLKPFQRVPTTGTKQRT